MRVVESGFAALDCSDEDKARKLAGNTSGRPPKLRDREEYARGGGRRRASRGGPADDVLAALKRLADEG